jgi:hypothetical protein
MSKQNINKTEEIEKPDLNEDENIHKINIGYSNKTFGVQLNLNFTTEDGFFKIVDGTVNISDTKQVNNSKKKNRKYE